MRTDCQCLCAPMGHERAICTEIAVPGLTAVLGRISPNPVPVCQHCHRAVVKPAFAPQSGSLAPAAALQVAEVAAEGC